MKFAWPGKHRAEAVDEKMPFVLATKARACGWHVNRTAWTFDSLPIRGGKVTVEERRYRLFLHVTAADGRTITRQLPRRHLNRALALRNDMVVRNIAALASE